MLEPHDEVEVTVGWPWRIWSAIKSAHVDSGHLQLVGKDVLRVQVEHVDAYLKPGCFLRSTIDMVLSDGATRSIRCVRRQDAKRFASAVARNSAAKRRERALAAVDEAGEVIGKLSALLAEQRWLRHTEVHAFEPLVTEASRRVGRAAKWMNEQEAAVRVQLRAYANLEARRREHNEAYVRGEMLPARRAIDDALGLSNSLTDEQLEALLTAEDCTLVLAGAGTGKTSVIAGKVAHLVERRRSDEGSILVLAFNRKAAAELRDRLKMYPGVRVSTFHALGRQLIGHLTGAAPSVASFAEDDIALNRVLSDFVTELINHPVHGQLLVRFFLHHMHRYRSAFEFSSPGDYYTYVRASGLVALSGDKVKSFEELEIANFLALNGITFAYEARYREPTATREHGQYTPDFYLSDFGIYIEHYGINREGATAPGIDATEYHKSIAWKRGIHEKYGSVCIETFSYERQEDTLLPHLEEQLRAHGVAFRAIAIDVLVANLRERGYMTRLASLLASFLKHYKSTRPEDATLRQRAAALPDPPRLLAFIDLFLAIFERYERELAAAGSLDFDDLILNALDLIEARDVALPFRHVLVDEFQDISWARSRLLHAIVASTQSELFTVGDDWQSIYAFAGSDNSILRNAADHFGFTQRCLLRGTFRFDRPLLDVSTRFVTANPDQISRDLLPAVPRKGGSSISITMTWDVREAVQGVLKQLERYAPDSSVLVLGRYRNSSKQVPPSRPKVTYSTVHAAKGLEADYVVIIDLKDDQFGFPSQFDDDPILDLVVHDRDAFLHAEERRLFYVAMTRARNGAFLIADAARPSAFIRELQDNEYPVRWDGMKWDVIPCPDCVSGRLLPAGDTGPWFRCSNDPLCRTNALRCSRCQIGALVPHLEIVRCSNTECRHIERLCPRCRRGQVVTRTSAYGPFLACSRYRSDPPCFFTQHIDYPDEEDSIEPFE